MRRATSFSHPDAAELAEADPPRRPQLQTAQPRIRLQALRSTSRLEARARPAQPRSPRGHPGERRQWQSEQQSDVEREQSDFVGSTNVSADERGPPVTAADERGN